MGHHETPVEECLTRYVEARGGVTRKYKSPSAVGVADRLVFWPLGVIHLVELKADDGELARVQIIEREVMERLGVYTFVLMGKPDVWKYIQWCDANGIGNGTTKPSSHNSSSSVPGKTSTPRWALEKPPAHSRRSGSNTSLVSKRGRLW